jgi:AcrR family transcriptional regulator
MTSAPGGPGWAGDGVGLMTDMTIDHDTGEWTEPAGRPGSRRRRGRPRDPDAEARIIGVAIQLLSERGFEKMTVDDVAEAAGVGKATIYRRWPSKEQLAYDAMTLLFDMEIPDRDTGSLEGDVRASFRSAIRWADTPQGRALLRLGVAEASRDENTAALYRAFLKRRVRLAAAVLERARLRGEPVHPDADPSMIVGFLTGLLVIRAVTGDRLPSLEDVDGLVRMTLRGIIT